MQQHTRAPSPRDDRRCLELVSSVQELLCAGKREEARRLILEGTLALLDGAAIFSTVLDRDQKTSSDPSRTAILGLEDWQLAVWQEPFFDDHNYFDHPIWGGVQPQRGSLRTARTFDVVSPRVWRAHPLYELGRALGMSEDTVASLCPLGDGRECLIAVSRRFEDKPFTQRDRELLHRLHGALRLPNRELAQILEAGPGRTPIEGLRLRLAPRLRPVLDLLLTGLSEKQIAIALGLGKRTIHKYVEVVFRSARVSSRAELMALFIPPHARGDTRRPRM